MSTPTHSPETSVGRAANTAPSGFRIPSTPTFSFKAPYNVTSSSSASSSSALPLAPSLKQRRVSLALPSSPRLVPAWSFRDDTGLESHIAETTTSSLTPEKRGKMRKIADTSNEDDEMTLLQEKKQRKKWTTEETAMLVEGCRIHGVGSWKTILSDPNLKFDNRSPVDLKDRFRTYFPDAYQKHYPNARTHLSSKVRSILPDGSSLFEKTRSKKRRPFTEEEDRALKAGYEKHGTVWATIVKDPVFQEQNRRSTDLRDRFRNAFPELYQAAGYKPRNSAKKKLHLDGPKLPIRAATDDQLPLSTGPVRSRRRAHTSQGILRGGTKSVPQSTVCSEDEDSSAGEDEVGSPFKTPQTHILVEKSSASSPVLKKRAPATFSPVIDDDDMVITNELVSDPLLIPDFLPPHPQSENDAQSQTWSSGLDTPVHSQHAWSNATGSPTSSHLSADYLMNSAHSSPYQRRSETMGNLGMIGKSAWGTDDWFSANPRLDPESSGSNSSFVDGGFSPASPFSFHNLNQGVLDRYDLFPTSVPHDFSSEVGVGDSHSTFSDEMFPPSGFRGFTHHSNYAGDLIFGARTHQSQPYHGSTLSFGGSGLGLSGMSQSTGIHPMQLHSSALPGIDEIELTNITLDDHTEPSHDAMEDDTLSASQHKNDPHDSLIMSDRFNLNDIVDLSPESHLTPPGTPLIQSRSNRRTPNSTFNSHYPEHMVVLYLFHLAKLVPRIPGHHQTMPIPNL
ncbi:hypothetical protein BD779DRAFT_1673605 [Infundibulicybe gibba]|nr:hypothetical protein BD779DRAFT_1673605 [Infundibulicybe gibba]